MVKLTKDSIGKRYFNEHGSTVKIVDVLDGIYLGYTVPRMAEYKGEGLYFYAYDSEEGFCFDDGGDLVSEYHEPRPAKEVVEHATCELENFLNRGHCRDGNHVDELVGLIKELGDIIKEAEGLEL